MCIRDSSGLAGMAIAGQVTTAVVYLNHDPVAPPVAGMGDPASGGGMESGAVSDGNVNPVVKLPVTPTVTGRQPSVHRPVK